MLRGTPRLTRTLLNLDLTLNTGGLPPCFFGVAPESQRHRRCADSQAAQRDIGKPRGKHRVKIQVTVRRIRLKTQN